MSKEKISLDIRDYAKAHYRKLDTNEFVLGEAPFNRRCHINAVQKIKEGKAEKVFLCFTIDLDSNSQCIHFINQLEDGKYQDNTWGWLYTHTEYYIIKEVAKEEYNTIWDILTCTKQSLVNMFASWIDKYILRIKAKDFI